MKTACEWLQCRTDPARDHLISGGEFCLDDLAGLLPPLRGEPAFDPDLIRFAADRVVTTPAVKTGIPLLDQGIRIGLAHIDATFQGDHPKYGVKSYADQRHDTFPPVIIATVDALSAWGLHGRAARLLRHWLTNFIHEDGTIRYYGPSLSEYGQLLHTAVLLYERAGPDGWWADARPGLDRLTGRLLDLCERADQAGDLLAGVPEADVSKADPHNVSDASHSENNRYFHNNAWIARGLLRWAGLLERIGEGSPATRRIRRHGEALAERTRQFIAAAWPSDPAAWWLPPQVEPAPAPQSLTATAYASYTNYRYWPELLSSGLLSSDQANRLVDARLTAGGQFAGTTRFADHLDDWPLADYLHGLWSLGRTEDFRLSLLGHLLYHQAEGHFTAYEQVSLPPGKELAPYCLPCQLVVARAGRLLVK